MSSARVPVLVSIAVLSTAALPLAAADVIENDITAHNGNDTIAPGETLTVSYSVVAKNTDGQSGCNPADGTPLTLSILPSSAAVIATPSSLVFTSCGMWKPVQFTANAPGNFRIDLGEADSGPGSYQDGTATFTLHVVAPAPTDTTPPTIDVPADITEEATGPGGATVTYTVSATDGGNATDVTCEPPSGSTFPIGTTTVTCSATDAAGNDASATFDVTVEDTTAADIAGPEDATLEATSADGATATWTASAEDAVDGALDVTCEPASGSTFPLGTTTVTCEATDAAGNTATHTFDITVEDTTPPEVDALDDLLIEATGPDGAPATWDATATDAIDGALDVSCEPPSGATFALGTTSVTCTATDASGNGASVTFDVTVEDTTPPELDALDDITLEATGPAGAIATFSAAATDVADEEVDVECEPASGSTFALGATIVACTATDESGNTDQGSFTITVVDTTPPSLALPADITLEATGPDGATATWTVSAEDLVDGAIDPTCEPAGGTTFALGATSVTCSASDAAGNAANGTFQVTVVDTTPPELIVPEDFTLEATGPSGAVATWSASADDLVDGVIDPTCDPTGGSTFALGTTTITCEATDAAGNTASASFDVTVVDTTPPALDLPDDITLEATGADGAIASWNASASDIVDGAVTVECAPNSGSTFALGTTTVTCEATDAAGNAASASFDVTVVDTTPPTLSALANLTLGATSGSGATGWWNASATDLVDGDVAVDCTPPSGSAFSLGTTNVTCSATDAAGNTASARFAVSVSLLCNGPLAPLKTGLTTVKFGSVVPIKCKLYNESAGVSDATIRLSGRKLNSLATGTVTAMSVSAADTGNIMRYSPTDDIYIYNFDTRILSKGTWQITMDLGGGQLKTFNLGLR